jgi:hypothetical protein
MSAPLPLEDMHLRHSGLTEAIARNNQEAATVCLSRHHTPPTMFRIENSGANEQAVVDWIPPNDHVRGAWNNRNDATEMGAYACVIAGIELSRGHVAVHRADTGTGADYYVAPPGTGKSDLERCYRLEVSGVDKGNDRDIRQRLIQKVEQARKGDSNLPAIAGVIGFAARMIVIADVEDAT